MSLSINNFNLHLWDSNSLPFALLPTAYRPTIKVNHRAIRYHYYRGKYRGIVVSYGGWRGG